MKLFALIVCEQIDVLTEYKKRYESTKPQINMVVVGKWVGTIGTMVTSLLPFNRTC